MFVKEISEFTLCTQFSPNLGAKHLN